MQKFISILLPLWLACAAVVAHAQAPAPAWLNKLKLSGISGTPQHRLATINNQTFSLDEENEVKVAGHTVRLKCLEIGQTSVIVYIQDTASRCALILNGVPMLLTPPPSNARAEEVVPVQPPAPSPTPPLLPVFSPSVDQPQTVASNNNSPPRTFSFTPLLLIGGIILALLVGIALGASASAMVVEKHKSQNEGEAMVAETISRQFKQPHLLINNVTLPTAGGTTQIDHVLITDTGIFIIETKHYSGWIFGRPSDSQWTQQIYRKKSTFQNPLRQNYGHVKALQSLFDLSEEVFQTVVVFTGEAEFKTDLGPNVLFLSKLVSFLSAKRSVVFDERKMAYVVGRIEMQRERRSLETDEYHINHVRRKIANKVPKPQNIVSPISVPAAMPATAFEHPHSRYMRKA